MLRPLVPGSSEADQLYKICSVLGTPRQSEWAEGYQLAAKIGFRFPQFVPTPMETLISNAGTDAHNLLVNMLAWSPQKRITASASLNHNFFMSHFQEVQRFKYADDKLAAATAAKGGAAGEEKKVAAGGTNGAAGGAARSVGAPAVDPRTNPVSASTSSSTPGPGRTIKKDDEGAAATGSYGTGSFGLGSYGRGSNPTSSQQNQPSSSSYAKPGGGVYGGNSYEKPGPQPNFPTANGGHSGGSSASGQMKRPTPPVSANRSGVGQLKGSTPNRTPGGPGFAGSGLLSGQFSGQLSGGFGGNTTSDLLNNNLLGTGTSSSTRNESSRGASSRNNTGGSGKGGRRYLNMAR